MLAFSVTHSSIFVLFPKGLSSIRLEQHSEMKMAFSDMCVYMCVCVYVYSKEMKAMKMNIRNEVGIRTKKGNKEAPTY